MKNIAIIPARGGSKRIPRKSIKNFCGVPILSYSIRAALESNVFDEVMVSTDDKEIAEIAKKLGAKVPFFRSAKNSDDYATTADVLIEVLESYSCMDEKFDFMCCIYPTAPFVTAEKLRFAYRILRDSEADSLMPVVRYSHPPQRALILRDNMLKYQYPEFRNSRTQDLPELYHDCGQFYFYKIYTDLSFKNDQFVPMVMPEMEVQDIDNESDWIIAELKYRLMLDKNKEKTGEN